MRLCRSVLLSSVFVLLSAGLAQAAQTLQPQGSWAVTKVDGKQPGAAPYCALARRFSNGSIVTFARNAANETSVATDFPPGSFKPGQTYTIALKAGAGETRSYKTQPVSERGIVIRMGRDDRFYQALAQSGALGISIDGQAYDFAMPDIKSGSDDLSACLGGAAQAARQQADLTAKPIPAVGKPAANIAAIVPHDMTAPAAVSAPAKPVSVSAANAAADDLQSLREENTRLRNAMARERRVYEDKMQADSGSAAGSELNEKLLLLQGENARLKSQLGAGGSAASVAAAAPAVTAPAACSVPQKADDTALNALKDENAQLKADLESQKQRVALVPDAAPLENLRAENTQLKTDLETQKQKLASLEAPQKTAASDAASVKGLAAQSADQTAAAAKRAAEAETQLAGLRDQISKLQSENDGLKSSLAQRQAASEESAKGDIAAVAKMHELELQMAQAKAERDRYAGQVEALKKPGTDVKIASDNWDLEKATERYNQAETEVRRMGTLVESERAKCTVEKKNIEAMLFDPKIASKEQVAKMASLENELKLAKQNQAKPSGPDKSPDEGEAAKTVIDLRQQLANANEELARLQRIDTAPLAPAAAPTAENTAENHADSQNAVMIETQRQQIASLNTQLANMRNEKSAMADRLSRISTASGDATRRIAPMPDSVVPSPPADLPIDAMASPLPEKPAPTAAAIDATPMAPPVSAAPIPLQAPTPVADAPALSTVKSTASPSNTGLMAQTDVNALLTNAGIPLNGPVQAVTDSGKGKVAYRWKTGPLTGLSEQQISEPSQFAANLKAYLDRAEASCKGQFAASPGLVNFDGSTRMSIYELACVDDKTKADNPSAAVVFYSTNGVFTTIAHEGTAAAMDAAMDLRDKVISALGRVKTASR